MISSDNFFGLFIIYQKSYLITEHLQRPLIKISVGSFNITYCGMSLNFPNFQFSLYLCSSQSLPDNYLQGIYELLDIFR